ncbi:MAG: hypothetical protein ABSG92_03630 [Conexivisphaerales archaeon]
MKTCIVMVSVGTYWSVTNSTGYAVVSGSWVGNFTVVVTYAGGLYTFPAWTGFSINVVTLSVPSGSTKIETVGCLAPIGFC